MSSLKSQNELSVDGILQSIFGVAVLESVGTSKVNMGVPGQNNENRVEQE